MTINSAEVLAYKNAHPTNTPGYCLEYWDAAARAAGYPHGQGVGIPNANGARARTPGISMTVPKAGFVWFNDPEGDVGFIYEGIAYFTDATSSGHVGSITVAQRLANLKSLHGAGNASLAGYSTNYLGVAISQPASSPVSTTGELKNGSSGTAVKNLQAGLNRVFPSYSKLTIDGAYGPKTEAVVKDFQGRAKLTVDGIVGPNTKAALARYGVTF